MNIDDWWVFFALSRIGPPFYDVEIRLFKDCSISILRQTEKKLKVPLWLDDWRCPWWFFFTAPASVLARFQSQAEPCTCVEAALVLFTWYRDWLLYSDKKDHCEPPKPELIFLVSTGFPRHPRTVNLDSFQAQIDRWPTRTCSRQLTLSRPYLDLVWANCGLLD